MDPVPKGIGEAPVFPGQHLGYKPGFREACSYKGLPGMKYDPGIGIKDVIKTGFTYTPFPERIHNGPVGGNIPYYCRHLGFDAV